MYKKSITYKDLEGKEITEDFYFNLSKAELAEWELSTPGDGLAAKLQRIIDAQDRPSLVREFKTLVLAAYGEKSEDGKHFIKSEELKHNFECCDAYSELFMELVSDEQAAIDFVNGIVPKIDAPKE